MLLTELQRINGELQQFSHIVSHDLNEPLRTMRNYVQLLACSSHGKLNSDEAAYIAFVTDAAQRMQMKREDFWSTDKRNAMTLVKGRDLRIVLIVMQAGTVIQAHQTDSPINVQVLEGICN